MIKLRWLTSARRDAPSRGVGGKSGQQKDRVASLVKSLRSPSRATVNARRATETIKGETVPLGPRGKATCPGAATRLAATSELAVIGVFSKSRKGHGLKFEGKDRYLSLKQNPAYEALVNPNRFPQL